MTILHAITLFLYFFIALLFCSYLELEISNSEDKVDKEASAIIIVMSVLWVFFIPFVILYVINKKRKKH